jgi:uracil-DNA glycosylase
MNILQLIKDQTDEEWQSILVCPAIDYDEINASLDKEYETYEPDIKILPNKENIFKAFKLCPRSQLKVVLLGMDCYINIKTNKISSIDEPEANGLAFSVNEGMPIPPSLRNLIKEMKDDIGGEGFHSSDFSDLAKQGILFLNSALTVRQHTSNSHMKIWQKYTDAIIQQISLQEDGVVFILLGKAAQAKHKYINTDRHRILEAIHPSPLSASKGFFGSKIYSKTNALLLELGKEPIKWNE